MYKIVNVPIHQDVSLILVVLLIVQLLIVVVLNGVVCMQLYRLFNQILKRDYKLL
ncbi:unnamed protein product, partial [Trichobilharzia regenti]